MRSEIAVNTISLDTRVGSQDIYPQHPPHEKQGNHDSHKVNYPIANRFRFSEIEHAAW